MSDYFAGPFGAPGNRPYQLPPPRGSEGLPVGSDPFLRQRNLPGGGDLGIQQDSNRTGQQLPSVSQLLTNTTGPPPSPYYPPTLANSIARAPGPPQHSFHHHDHQISPVTLYERPPGYAASPAEHLPPLTHAVPSPRGNTPPRPLTGPSPTAQTQHSPFSYRDPTLQTKSLGEGSPTGSISPSIATGAVPPVRPHVVDERYIDGEGLCYIYADGSYCPKNVDGVPVNANWGITKAGKPRKRLAQACLTCREKKIKCHPNLPKCDQCQRSGRVCRFENAPRGNRASLKASRYDGKDLPSGPFPSPYSAVRASESSTSLPGSGQSPVSDGPMITPSAADSTQESMSDPEKSFGSRMQGSLLASSADEPRRPVSGAESQLSPEYAEILMEMKEIDHGDSITEVWNTDPYGFDPDVTIHYMESYFANVNDSLYHMFPQRRFFLWLQSCQKKSLEDKMLLYSMLTMGTVFSDRPDRLIAMRRYSRTARYAVERCQHSLSLQLAQSRIILSLWFYAVGALVRSWDSIGAVVRIVCGLRYNMESGGVIVDRSHSCEYGLHPQALMECRRRTFWVAYLMDRLSSFYSQSSMFIPSQTAFLRLPCLDDIFEAQEYATVPYFQTFLNNTPLSPVDDSSISPMAFWIEIVSIWGDVVQHVSRLPHIPAESYNKVFQEFHTTTVRQLEEWTAKLPPGLTFTSGNLERSVRTRKTDTFISIHLLFHATLMKLNRHARYQSLHPVIMNQHIHQTRHHAVEILRICAALAEYEPLRSMADPTSLPPLTLNPFVLYVIVSAVDVLSAIGLVSDLPESINMITSGLDAAKRIGRFWDSSIPLISLIESRLSAVAASLQSRTRLEGKAVFAMDSPSLDSQVGASLLKDQSKSLLVPGEDLMYGGLPRERLFNALGLDDISLSEGNILRIKDNI